MASLRCSIRQIEDFLFSLFSILFGVFLYTNVFALFGRFYQGINCIRAVSQFFLIYLIVCVCFGAHVWLVVFSFVTFLSFLSPLSVISFHFLLARPKGEGEGSASAGAKATERGARSEESSRCRRDGGEEDWEVSRWFYHQWDHKD